jgi:hypothetical protein
VDDDRRFEDGASEALTSIAACMVVFLEVYEMCLSYVGMPQTVSWL